MRIKAEVKMVLRKFPPNKDDKESVVKFSTDGENFAAAIENAEAEIKRKMALLSEAISIKEIAIKVFPIKLLKIS